MTSSSQDPAALPAQEAATRLDRLEKYLREDPNNASLLIDAFETALRGTQWERAEFHLRHGQALAPGDWGWALREGDYWLAQCNYAQARAVLGHLQAMPGQPAGFGDVLLHNLAFIDFQEGQFAACVARLAPRLEGHAPGGAEPTALRELQRLWLRALHHADELRRACAWALQAEQAGTLDAQAAGVASLAAFDASDLAAAQRWSAIALAQAQPGDAPLEALVAQASLALAARDAAKARQLADAALQLRPNDGRAWSARAFASMLAGELPVALRDFAHALATMPQHIGTWHGQGWAQVLQRDLPGARSSFETALGLDRNFAESHGGLAVVLALQQQRAAAQEHVELAMRLDRNNLSGRYAQALLSGSEEDAQNIQRLVQRLLGGDGAAGLPPVHGRGSLPD